MLQIVNYRLKNNLIKATSYLILFLTSCISLYPMVVMIINSFKSDAEMNTNPAGLPLQWTLASYIRLLTYYSNSLLGFRNAVIIAVTSTICAVFFCGLAAYAFAKYSFPGRNALFAIFLSTSMVPFEITMAGLYIMSSSLHMINTFAVQILPTITPVFGLFFIRQYMLSIPNELLEAARVDGAGHFTVFGKLWCQFAHLRWVPMQSYIFWGCGMPTSGPPWLLRNPVSNRSQSCFLRLLIR